MSNTLNIENINKLMDLGFSEEESINALSVKKNIRDAAHLLVTYGNKPAGHLSFQTQKARLEAAANNDYNASEGTNLEGRIKFMDLEKAFGFIRFNTSDIFFHFSDKTNTNDDFEIGDDVTFNIGENQNKGKNNGRMCGKNVRLKVGSNATDGYSNDGIKKQGIIVEVNEEHGFIQDAETLKNHVFFPKEIAGEILKVGDRVLFFLEIKTTDKFQIVKAVQIKKVTEEDLPEKRRDAKTADPNRGFFYRYETYPGDESRSVEFKALTKTKQTLQRVMEYSEKYLVAFLNADGGKTLFGILDNGIIIGLKLNRKQRDEIRLIIDRTVSQIRPVVTNDMYSVNFIPVYDKKTLLEDFYVVSVECVKGNNIYVDGKDIAWIRRDGSVRSISIPMAHALWTKKMKKKKSLEDASGGPENLQEILRSVIRKELKSVIGGETLTDAKESNENDSESNLKTLENGNETINLIDLKELDLVAPKMNGSASSGSEEKREKIRNPPKKSKSTKFDEEVVEKLTNGDFKLAKVLECLYVMSKEGVDVNAPENFENIVRRLSETKKAKRNKPELEPSRDLKSRETEEKAAKTAKRSNSEQILKKSDDVYSNDGGNDLALGAAYSESEGKHSAGIFDRVESAINEVILENKIFSNENSGKTENLNNGQIEGSALEDQINNEVLDFFCDSEGDTKSQEKSKKRAKTRSKYNKDNKASGFLDYFDSQLPEKNKNPLDAGFAKNVVNEQNVREVTFEEDFFSEKKLYFVSELVYPTIKTLLERNSTYKNALTNFVNCKISATNFSLATLPVFKSSYSASEKFKAIVSLKIDRVKYSFMAKNGSSEEVMKEIACKKAMCALEEKGVLFVYKKGK